MAAKSLFSLPVRDIKHVIRIFSLRHCQIINGHAERFHQIVLNTRFRTVTTLKLPQFGGVVSLAELPNLHLDDKNCRRPSSTFHHPNWEDCSSASSGSLQASRQCFRLLPGRGCATIGLHVPARHFHGSGQMWAGHNKWSKVKHIKGPKDNLRSLMFNKLILQMRIAIKEHGPDPELNSMLASLITQAKQHAMPKTTIENVLKNVAKNADTQLLLEARGPGQSCLLIDVLTDNAKRTRSEVQRILQKNGGDFGTCLYAFTRKGVVKVLPHTEGQENPLTLDFATEVAIEVGAEDVQETSSEEDSPLFMFICDMGDLRTVRNNLASLNYAIESSSFEYLPETSIALNDKNVEDTFQLISLLNDNPNVVKVYDNVEISS